MIRLLKWSVLLGLLAFILTFLLSIQNNTWQTALFRACIGFLVFIFWGYGIQRIMQSALPVGEKVVEMPISEIKIEDKLSSEDSLFQAVSLETLHNAEHPLDFDKKL